MDAAWVSKNGNEQLGHSQGSDDLRFDFRVEYRRQTWQIEAKASVGDQQRFVMGETEVRAAREAARPRSNTRYVVVCVANPHDPANARIDGRAWLWASVGEDSAASGDPQAVSFNWISAAVVCAPPGPPLGFAEQGIANSSERNGPGLVAGGPGRRSAWLTHK